jgi:ferric hydroxamate transport system substrate-binding protein
MAATATRRAWLAQAVTALVVPGFATDARAKNEALRIVTLDWALTETVLALGAIPIGIAEAGGYRRRVILPSLPDAVVDVGLRIAPSLELLQQLAPTLILAPPWIGANRTLLDRVGHTVICAIYTGRAPPYDEAQQVTADIGRRLGRDAAVTAYLARANGQIADARARLSAQRRPFYIVSFVDRLHVGVYGKGSLFDDVVRRLGLANAWRGETRALGVTLIGIDQLTENADATLIYIEPLPAGMSPDILAEPLWRNLPFVAAGRVVALPPVWLFGAVPSAVRFAQLLAQRLDAPRGRA